MNTFAFGTLALALAVGVVGAGWFALELTDDGPASLVVVPVQAAAPPPDVTGQPGAVLPNQAPRTERIGFEDGYIDDSDSVSPFDESHPAIANLDPALGLAMQDAAQSAATDGIEFRVTAGWRSARYQQALFDAAVEEYGSEPEASRWVATVDSSAHVTGLAIDVDADTSEWLRAYGPAFGLCQVYANEPWHFELTAEWGGCPELLPDASWVR
jgi:D-alanyl-D-alanine carboxypeptidase